MGHEEVSHACIWSSGRMGTRQEKQVQNPRGESQSDQSPCIKDRAEVDESQEGGPL